MSEPFALLPPPYRAELDRLIREARDTIQEALGYIERQEDGPFTMTVAIKEIDARLDAIETEASMLAYTAHEYTAVVQKLTTQRNEAIHQRDLLLMAALRARRYRW